MLSRQTRRYNLALAFIAACAILAACIALAQDRPAKFLMPKSKIVLAGPSGYVTFYFQAWVTRHKDNRAVVLSYQGDGCSGSATNQLEGEYSDATQPAAPLKVTASLGVCTLWIHLYGPGDKLRYRDYMEMEIK